MRIPLPKLAACTAGLGVVGALAVSTPGAATTAASAASSERVACATGATRQGDFIAASQATGVPRDLLLAVSYMQSRWDDHDGAPSTSGGYGPMHLTDAPADLNTTGRGDGETRPPLMSANTLQLASRLTGLDVATLRTNPGANICGGAAVLAYFQRAAGHRLDAGLGGWADAVARYSGSGDPATAGRFVRQVYTVLQHGAARTTNDGEQMRLGAHSQLRQPRPAADGSTASDEVSIDCPRSLETSSLAAEPSAPGRGWRS